MVNCIIGSFLIEWEIVVVGIFAVYYSVACGAEANEIELGIIAAPPTWDVVMQVDGAPIGAEYARIGIAQVDFAPCGCGDCFCCV